MYVGLAIYKLHVLEMKVAGGEGERTIGAGEKVRMG